MAKTFYCFVFTGSMLDGDCAARRKGLTPEQAIEIIKEGVVAGYNPNHVATMVAMKQRYGIEVPPPPMAPKIKLQVGDRVLTMEIENLPRETREYTQEEVAKATYRFALYTIEP